MARPSYSESEVQEIEDRIQAAALQVFAAEGYRNFSLRAVARQMGLTPPALYRYVDNKDSLLAEIRAEGFRRLGDIFRDLKNERTKPELKARKLMHAYLQFAYDEPALYCVMYELDQDEAPLPGWAHEIRQSTFNVALDIARDFAHERDLDIEPLHLVHLWWSGIHGLAGLDLAKQLNMGASREALLEPLIGLLTNVDHLQSTFTSKQVSN